MRKKIIKLYASILSCGFLYYVLIQYVGLSFPCIYNEYFGIQCPGCGVTRMFKSILKFDFYEAFMYNQCAFILLVFWNLIAILLFIGTPKFIKKPVVLWTLFALSIVALFIFGIVRNLG